MCTTAQTATLCFRKIVPTHRREFCLLLIRWQLTEEKEGKMLGIIAAILIVLWLLGFFAFHITSGLIHIVLVVGLIVLILHFVRGRSGT